MSAEFSRRDFLAICSVLAASACTTGLRTAEAFLTDPAYDEYRDTLRALIETVLPRRFPLDTNEVERRLLQMFPLEEERRFLGFQKTLVYFDALDLAPHVASPLIAAERVALDVPERLSEREFDALCETKTRGDAQSADAFFAQHGRSKSFATLAPDARAAWLRTWNASEYSVKRDFARSVRILVCVAAYSSDRVWPAIGYDGPLLQQQSPLPSGERARVRGESRASGAPHPDPLPGGERGLKVS